MNFISSYLLSFVLVFGSVFSLHTGQLGQSTSVRVLLDDQESPSWTMQSSHGFKFCTSQGKEINLGVTYSRLTIKHVEGSLFINNKKLKQKEIWFVPYKNEIKVGENIYKGKLGLAHDGAKWLLINEIDSEEYTYSVLGSEGWPGWPLGFFQVLAVSVRSYLFYQLQQAEKQKKLYHIKNSNYHQTYAGIHHCKIIRQAVEDTKNMVLLYEEKPILAMFDCCCGGVVPKYIKGFIDFKKAPYLARSYACTYCKKSKLYSWRKEYVLQDFSARLQENSDSIIYKIKDIRVTKKDKAGLVQEVSARTAKSEHIFTVAELYKTFKDIKSYCFSLLKRGTKLIIKGRGYGHHMGLCQWGARQMIDDGHSYKKVLSFYYPGTTLKKVTEF